MGKPGPDLSTPSGIPGKQTLVQAHAVARAPDIGDRYIEDRGACAAGGPGCELTPHQFDLLVAGYQKRVNAAEARYAVALSQVRFERMLKKPEDTPVLLALMLDVLAGAALGGVMSVLRMVKGGAVVRLDRELEREIQSGSGEPSTRPSMAVMLAGIDEASVGWVAKAGIDQAKKSIAKPPAAPDDMALDYMTQLERVSAVAWQHQREDPPGYATHADMIVLFHSFDAANGHTTPDYKAALEAKIDRYVASSAARIGRNQMRTEADIQLQGNTVRDTKVVWVRRKSNPTVPTLYYYKRDFANAQPPHTLENLDVTPLQPIDETFVLDRPVENELVDTAIHNHRAAWGTEPETQVLDDSQVPRFPPARDVRDLTQFVPRGAGPANSRDQLVPPNSPAPGPDPAPAASPLPVVWHPK